MAEIRWIKITTDLFDDEKILLIESMPKADSILVIWFKMLCLAGKQNNNGILAMSNGIAYTDEMLAKIFRRSINSVKLALKMFADFGMIEIVNDVITIPKWQKHQNIDGLDKIREQTKKRVANCRKNQKLQLNTTNSNATCNATVTQCNATEEEKIRKEEIRTEVEKEKEKEMQALALTRDVFLRKNFVKPAIDEIRTYCQENGYTIDSERFFDYYESNGWKVGHGIMRDWRAAVRNWQRRENEKPKPQTTMHRPDDSYWDLFDVDKIEVERKKNRSANNGTN